ncbi:MAG: ABC transporter permease [Candidatus Dormibacteria bacterium]
MTHARALRLLRGRSDAAVLMVLLVASAGFAGGLPANTVLLGVIAGCPLALQAVGLVLVYRSNRIINFAQAQMGVVASVVLFALLSRHLLLTPVWSLCQSCVVTPGSGLAFVGGTVVHGTVNGAWADVEFIVALLISWGVGALLSLAVYHGVVRRFGRAPRLIVTVVTLGVAVALSAIASLVGHLLTGVSGSGSIGGALPIPFADADFKVGGTYFHTLDILVVVSTVVALSAIALYLLRSARGVAMRSASDNPERAQTLGIDVGSVTGSVWLLSGMLSTVAATVTGVLGVSGDIGDIGVATIVRMLAVAVIARMSSLPVAAVAAIVLGVVNQLMLSAFHSETGFEVLLAVVTCGFLLLQRTRSTRAEQDVAAAWPANREVRPVPRELRDVSSVALMMRGGTLLLIVVTLAFPWFMDPASVGVGSATLIFAMLAFSLLVLTGWTGQISLGHMALAGVGAYLATWLGGSAGVPFVLVLVIASLGGGVAALLIGLPALRVRGLFLAATTLAFAVVVSDVVLDQGHLGAWLPFSLSRPLLFGIDLGDDRAFYYVCAAALLMVIGLVMGMRRSRTARVLIAARDNPAAAQSFGINPVRAQLSAFVISGCIAAFAGAMFAYEQHGMDAATYAPGQGIELFLLAVIGGFGSLAGPIAAAVFSFLLSLSVFAQFGFGFGLVVLLLFAPGGLTQIVVGARDGILRQVALRRRILVPSLLADYRPGSRGDERAALAPPPKETRVVLPAYTLGGQWTVGGGSLGGD